MYTVTNYPSKKAFRADFAAGKQIEVFQPGGFFAAKTDGEVSIEGPHYPKPHTWYARVRIVGGVIVKVLG
jgi:hypothetical protein